LNGQGIVVSSSKTAVVDALNDTNMYVFEGTNGLCVARDTILLIETDGPGIEAGFDRSIEPGEEVTIGGDPTANNGVEVTWTPDQDITSTTIFNPIVNPLRTTTYYVSGIDNDECFGVDSAVVTVEKIVDPVGGFSPNGDGVNDFFVIDRISKFPDAQVQIFNRWGNLIFTSDKGYTKPWNGKFNGNGLSVGTYYYAIDLNVDGEEIITGPISILK
jgi:gliding motility-associated-like protein